MSQIATLRVIPVAAVEAIRAAVEPQEMGWLGRPKDAFWDTVGKIAPDILNLYWSGYAVAVLFEFLRERRDFDFTGIDDHPLAQFLSEARESYFAVFEAEAAGAFVEKLSTANLVEAELAEFANDFSATNDADAGKPLVGAAQSIQAALAQVRPGSIGLLNVG